MWANKGGVWVVLGLRIEVYGLGFRVLEVRAYAHYGLGLGAGLGPQFLAGDRLEGWSCQ